MIGKVTTGHSFAQLISYCLLGRHGEKEGLVEILNAKMCGGEKKELIKQFEELSDLNNRTKSPVWHTSISFHETDSPSKQELIDIAEEYARMHDFKQYLLIQHFDTAKRIHFHMVCNRIKYDGKSVSTSLNYKKMDEFCRRMEIKYDFHRVLSAKRFLKKEDRKIPRQDNRKLSIKEILEKSLPEVSSVNDLIKKLKEHGITTEKGRGITFIDNKKVRVKGSEIGFSLKNIEKKITLTNKLSVPFSYKKSIKRNL